MKNQSVMGGKKLMDKKVGSVLVIGSGIAGMQSALDLADAGFKVYLLEESPTIGGTMAQLDKTFPTNDCSMCILSPKMIDVSRHPNIELITYAELTKIKGKQGNFEIIINKKARSIDESLCNGCGLCVENCLVRFKPQKTEIKDAKKNLDKNTIEKINKLIKKFGKIQSSLIQILESINDDYNYLPENILRYVSQEIDVPISQVYHVATFYSSFSLEPRGKHLIKVCMGTACHVRGSPKVLDEIERYLDIKPGETTKDGLFTLQTVNCLGACALGPVIVIDEEYYPVYSAKVDSLLKKISLEEK